MKQFALVTLAIAFTCTAFCQMPKIQWQKSHGGSGSDEAYSIQPTMDGGYIIVGPSLSWDGEVTGHHDSTNYDYWAVKLNDTGGIQWERSLGGSMDDIGRAVIQTADSGFLVAGGIESSNGDVTSCSPMEYDYWVVKLSPSGVIEWNSCFGGSNYNQAFAAQQIIDGNYILAGTTYSTDTPVTGNHGAADYWVVELSSTGSLLWEKCLGGSGMDQAKSIRQTMDGGFIVAGSSSSTDGQVTGNHGGTDYWVVKLNDTGAVQWEKSLGGSGEDIGYEVQQTFDGGYIMTGNSNSTDSEVTGNHGGADYWVVKLNSFGALQWEKSLGGGNDDLAYSIQQTSDSGYVVAGSTSSAPGGNVTDNHGLDDYWVVKLSKYGNLQWQKSLGGSGTDDAFGVRQTADSGFIVAGGSNSNDSEVSGNHGNFDYWVVKLSKCLLDSPTITRTLNTLSVTGTFSYYQWVVNGTAVPGATNTIYEAADIGSYNVNVSDSNGCVGTTKTFWVYEGVPNVLNPSAISLLPNPTTGIVQVVGAGHVNISIYNTIGQLLKESTQAEKISIADLPPGLYFVRLHSAEGILLKEEKVIKL